MRDELDTRLDAVAGKGSRFRYTYDFGDWWEHELVVEDICAADPESATRICVDGERACPPEDVGGAVRLSRVCSAALADPTIREHEAMRDWVGRAVRPRRLRPRSGDHPAAPVLLSPVSARASPARYAASVRARVGFARPESAAASAAGCAL